MTEYRPEAIHLEMLGRLPELGEDFGFAHVVGSLAGWMVEQILDEEALARAFAFVEWAASDDDPRVRESVARPVVEDFRYLYGTERMLPWMGPETRRLLERG